MIEASKSGLPVDLAQVLPILDEIVCDILMVWSELDWKGSARFECEFWMHLVLLVNRDQLSECVGHVC